MRTIRITIDSAEVLLELARYSYTVGEQIGDDSPKVRHYIQGATDSGHIDLLLARLDEAWLDLQHTLSAYSRKPEDCKCGCNVEECDCRHKVADTEEDATADNCTEYTMTLYFPDRTMANLGWDIAQCVKRYMTASARSEWDLLTSRSDGTVAEAQADRALSRLRVLINTRI